MSRSGRPAGERLKTGKGRTASSTRWLTRQLNDPYVKAAKDAGWRSRAAFKLIELDQKYALLKNAKRVVDLGVAPGGWSQVVRKQAPKAAVVGIDLLETEPLDGVTLFQMDFMDDAAPGLLVEALGGTPDLVISDMAANTVGHKATDHLRTMGLVETAAHFAIENLAPGGAFVAKVLAGGTDTELLALLKRHFTAVKHAKPPASRKDSSEWYVIAQGFKG
ncbi:MAG: RlmE family RNA methyltransferase [Novosphingobium sp.]|jgi:23S rRNA (uridine2552-2'-O)-methyltransferase|uniref:RlmE family RNA methyltransferase n=1 Tax=Novosphingobium sp. TaxID=1874826 RepID=UPI00391D4D04